MTEYTLGFCFSKDLKQILLINRQQHEFHSYKSNGLGGKIIIGESPTDCIIREVKEEAGIQTNESDWKFIGIINGATWKVWVFSAKIELIESFPTTHEGTLHWFDCKTLPDNIVPNLSWMIPFAIDKWQDETIQSFVVWYAGQAKHS
jgi:8-oxo-dGTP diphosphatase